MEEKYEQLEFSSEKSAENMGISETERPDLSATEENAEVSVEINAHQDADNKEIAVDTVTQDQASEKVNENTEESGEKNEGNPTEAEKKPSRKRTVKNAGEQSDGTETPIAPEKMPKAEAMRVLEAILFANGDEVYYDQFAKIIGYTTKEATKIVDAYAKMYDSGSLPRGIRLVKYDKCCQLTTAPDLGEYVTQMIGIRGEPQLSAAAMETLAIVAYNQPVTRAYIEQVRRVDSTRPIAVLLDRELIEEKGRLEVIGRPRLFGTTQNFLKTFGITSLEALPSLDLFAVEG